MSLRRIGLVLAAAAGFAQSQEPGGSLPATFEVASVKPSGAQSKRGSKGGPGSSDPGRYSFDAGTLQDFIAIGYHVEYFQISSKVSLDKQAFDLAAKLPPGTTKPQFRVMMQNLLAERFHLKAHIESREFDAYELVVAKNGPKLKESAGFVAGSSEAAPVFPENGFPILAPNRPGIASRHSMNGGYLLVRMSAQQEPMSVLAGWLQPPDGRPVVDKTGLTGKYDFTFEYTGELSGAASDSAAQPPAAPDLFTALQQQLGLQLVRRKVPFDVVVVESFDKMPVEN